MIKCNRCSLKLGIFKRKYPHEDNNDNTVILCGKCNEILVEEIKIKLKEEENLGKIVLEKERTKNKEIIEEYLEKYLASKDWNENMNIPALFQANNTRKLFTDYANTLVFARRQIESDLEYLLSLNAEDSDPENNKEVLEGVERSEEYIELFDDLEKLYKLLEKKGIKTDYLELITLLSNIITGNFRIKAEEGYKPFFVKMSNRLGENASKEEVIKEWLTIMHDTGNHPSIISVVLDKFNIKYEMQELGGLVDRLIEEIDLETFEKDMESPNKIIAIEELSKLSGNNLENHLEAIFGRLGWDVQELHLFDNQTAEFIVTEDDETIAARLVIGIEKVTENEIQKVLSLKKKYLAGKCMVVTDSIFTNNAARYAGSNNIELLDGKKLRKMLRRSKPSASDSFLNQTETSTDQLSLGVLSIVCPFCESDIHIEQEKLPEKGGEHVFNCPICGMELMLSPKPDGD